MFAASPLLAKTAARSSFLIGNAATRSSAIANMAKLSSESLTAAPSASATRSAAMEQIAVAVSDSYSHSMKFFHWATAAGVLTCFGTVQFAMRTEDKDLKSKAMMVHKSTGLLVAALVVPRIANRLLSKIPAHHPEMHAIERVAADAGHYALYGMMVAMPATGIAMGYYGGKGLPFFGRTIPGATETKPEIAKKAFKAHKVIGQAFELLVPGHIGAVGLHALRGQNVLGRMAGAFASK